MVIVSGKILINMAVKITEIAYICSIGLSGKKFALYFVNLAHEVDKATHYGGHRI